MRVSYPCITQGLNLILDPSNVRHTHTQKKQCNRKPQLVLRACVFLIGLSGQCKQVTPSFDYQCFTGMLVVSFLWNVLLMLWHVGRGHIFCMIQERSQLNVYILKKAPTDESQLICHGWMGVYVYSLFCTFASGKICVWHHLPYHILFPFMQA